MIHEVAESLQSVELEESRVLARFRFGSQLRIFAGHFPGYPLVPAVFQLAMVRVAVARALDRELRIQEVVDSKFKAELRPDQDVEVAIDMADEDPVIVCKATLTAEHGIVATLRLRLVEG